MIRQLPSVEQFKQQLYTSLLCQAAPSHRTMKFAKHAHIYTCGDQEQNVYFLESGQVKLLMLSPEGNECLLAILTAGDIFGELCLSGLSERTETAVAMTKTVIRVMPCAQFLGASEIFSREEIV